MCAARYLHLTIDTDIEYNINTVYVWRHFSSSERTRTCRTLHHYVFIPEIRFQLLNQPPPPSAPTPPDTPPSPARCASFSNTINRVARHIHTHNPPWRCGPLQRNEPHRRSPLVGAHAAWARWWGWVSRDFAGCSGPSLGGGGAAAAVAAGTRRQA